MNKLTKFLQTIWHEFKIKLRKKNSNQVADDEEQEGMDEEDENPGNTTLTDGAKDKTAGINKKMVNTVLVGVAITFLVAFLYARSDNAEEVDNQQRNQITEQPATQNNGGQGKNGTLDYRDAQAQLMQEANKQKNGANGISRNPDASAMGANGQAQAARTAANTQVPAIRSGGQQYQYNSPYMLPSALAQIDNNARLNAPNQQVTVATPQANNAEKKEKDDLMDRFKSAISFAIGGGDTSSSGSSGNTSSEATSSGYANSSYYAPSSAVLQAGTMFPAMLHTGINTDHEGQVIAMIQSNIYDTATGSTLLIPMGSKIIGSYAAGAKDNSDRVSVTFYSIVFPDGGSYSIGNSMIAVDDQGYSGIRGKLNKHMDSAIGKTMVNGLLSAGITALSTIGTNKATIDTSGIQQLMQNSTSISPTVTIEPGYTFNIFVTQPVSFSY